MATVHDVAAYILQKHGPMSAMKLQRLVYYSQAWALVWDGEPLFPERIEAWPDGPVVRERHSRHRWQSLVANGKGYPSALTPAQRATVDTVLEFYGDKSAQCLSDLTDAEAPWRAARVSAGLGQGERGAAEIPLESMAKYYGSLSSSK